MSKFLKDMLSARSGQTSSKRVMGSLAWLVVLFVYLYCTIKQYEVPDGIGEIIMGATSLLGIDSVTHAFDRNKNL